jgi:hypothetical protein
MIILPMLCMGEDELAPCSSQCYCIRRLRSQL